MGTQIIERYPCEVHEVFSGDDLVVMLDLGVENLHKKQRIRLHGVDTPNAVKAKDATKAGEIRQYVRSLTRRRRGYFEATSKSASSWVGILVVDTPEGQINVNEMLISKGYQYQGK